MAARCKSNFRFIAVEGWADTNDTDDTDDANDANDADDTDDTAAANDASDADDTDDDTSNCRKQKSCYCSSSSLK